MRGIKTVEGAAILEENGDQLADLPPIIPSFGMEGRMFTKRERSGLVVGHTVAGWFEPGGADELPIRPAKVIGDGTRDGPGADKVGQGKASHCGGGLLWCHNPQSRSARIFRKPA